MAGLQLPNPPPSSPAVRNVMRANRAKNTGPELRLRRALREAGLGGYRLNWKKAPGRPDIAYPGRKLAIFVHGCYWHHCPRCYPNLPKSQLRILGPQVRAKPGAGRTEASPTREHRLDG